MALQLPVRTDLDLQGEGLWAADQRWDAGARYAPGSLVTGSDNMVYSWTGAATIANSDPVGGTAGMPWTAVSGRSGTAGVTFRLGDIMIAQGSDVTFRLGDLNLNN